MSAAEDNAIEVKVLTPEEQTGDLKQRIEKVADQVGEFYHGYMEVRKSVKESLEEIVDLGINTYQMEQIKLRDLIDETFAERHVSLSYLRKLLPETLKMTARTNKRFLKEEGQQALEDTSSLSFESQPDTDVDSVTTSTNEDYGQLLTSQQQLETEPPQEVEIKKVLVAEHLLRDYRQEIKRLRQQVQTLQSQLGEIFTAKAIVDITGSQIPVVVTVDPRKQEVRSVEADDDTIKKIAQNQVRNAKK